MDQLTEFIAKESMGHDAPDGLLDAVRSQFSNPDAVQAVLLYGSGLWQSADADTIWDLYVLIDDYAAAGAGMFAQAAGRLLPPNVYYIDAPVRCKYAVMRMDQFEAGCAGQSPTPQIWARFAQPCRVLYACDEAAKERVVNALAEAVITFHRKTLPYIHIFKDAHQVWVIGLKETYSSELRSERDDRPEKVFHASMQSFEKRTTLAMPIAQAKGVMSSKPRWVLKLIAFARLIKASLFFDGGVDYALWKIERHSGVRVEANDFQRKYPLIGAWPLLWKIYRAGGLR